MSVLDAWNGWRIRRRTRKAAAFWEWFRGIAEPLSDLEELNRRTAAFHPTVRAVLGQSADLPELVLTAEGNRDGAEYVRFLVAACPVLPGWTIRAFKPALENCVVHIGAITLTPDEVEFAVIDVNHPDLGDVELLLLFVPGVAGVHSKEASLAARKLVEAVVGEEAFFDWSGRLVIEDRERPAEKVASIERRPLSELAAVLCALHHSVGNPRSGTSA